MLVTWKETPRDLNKPHHSQLPGKSASSRPEGNDSTLIWVCFFSSLPPAPTATYLSNDQTTQFFFQPAGLHAQAQKSLKKKARVYHVQVTVKTQVPVVEMKDPVAQKVTTFRVGTCTTTQVFALLSCEGRK